MISPSYHHFYVMRHILIKWGLFPSIFVLGPLEISCMVRSWDLVCELWFTNLVLPSDLCARMLGRLEVKILKASRVGSIDAWSIGIQDPQCPIFSLSVTKSLRDKLACLTKGQASPMQFGLRRASP